MYKLITLNFELNKHYKLNIPFIKSEKPDILCAQEIFEKDVEYLKNELGFKYSAFIPTYLLPYSDRKNCIKHPHDLADEISQGLISGDQYEMDASGTVTFSNYPILNTETYYYWKKSQKVEIHNSKDREMTDSRGLLMTDIDLEGKICKIFNTHFTWAYKGIPSDDQRADVVTMLNKLENYDEFILCGDFNAPRGTEIYQIISEKYKDNLPLEFSTTIDPILHRAGDVKCVVDTIFSKGSYKIESVHTKGGVSDHLAVIGSINLTHTV